MSRQTSEKAESAKTSSILLSALTNTKKNNALNAIAQAINKARVKIKAANRKDLEKAKKKDISLVLQKRLKFDDAKINEVISGIKDLTKMEDPIGKTLKATELDKDLKLYCLSCPIGVIGVIFESRPDALVQISSLCLKSGNSVLLKGGKEALNTNKVLYNIIKKASEKNGAPKGWIQLLESRDDVKKMLKLDQLINLVVPRGSNAFVRFVMDHTHIPVLGHADGICHVYVDTDADLKMALNICKDSKCQYPAACNALETLLVNKKIAKSFLPKFKEIMDEEGVKLLADPKARKIIPIAPADEVDWRTEYTDLILSIKIVSDVDEAINHINTYGSHHTDVIITKNKDKAEKFMQLVDSADVFHNCSTRFADGYRYGLGAEVGISTSKIHARGPVGIEGLIIYKWKLLGNGNIVADYSGSKQKRKFTHKKIK